MMSVAWPGGKGTMTRSDRAGQAGCAPARGARASSGAASAARRVSGVIVSLPGSAVPLAGRKAPPSVGRSASNNSVTVA